MSFPCLPNTIALPKNFLTYIFKGNVSSCLVLGVQQSVRENSNHISLLWLFILLIFVAISRGMPCARKWFTSFLGICSGSKNLQPFAWHANSSIYFKRC